jgi:hypothetical protein
MLNHNKSGFETDLEPAEFYLSQNYPNPFKEKTVIKYCVAQTTRVKIKVFDSRGNEIIKLVDEEKNPGTYEVIFNVAQVSRLEMANGNYSYKLEAGDYKNEMKMELIK